MKASIAAKVLVVGGFSGAYEMLLPEFEQQSSIKAGRRPASD